MNRLKDAHSPYLLQHKDNPVHWWEWGEQAFEEARRLDRPILLSIGYAACHWCHVMAHESFEDPGVAAVMNQHFVNIKVDREERPDVDHVYMSALQLLGEQGGWPLTMFMTPDGEPFWGGTYFPKESRFGRPGFVQVLMAISRLYREEPDRIRHNRTALIQHLSTRSASGGAGTLSVETLDKVGAALVSVMDSENGGLKGAPKFPNPPILEYLLRHARRTGDREARRMFLLTLDRMALGGIHDHVGGGFARYSTDARWLVPHFEKMLYDNAQLLELYAFAAAESDRALYRDAAEGIVTWLAREMLTPSGAFAASLDADSEGQEGRFYVWSLEEIQNVLGSEADVFAKAYDLTPEGNWEHSNIPNRLLSGEASGPIEERLGVLRKKLLEARDRRIRPALDDKILADWNGLMIASLVRSAMMHDRPEWLDLAEHAYRFIAESMSRDGTLGHSWRDGALIFPGFALDHAAMMRAALAFYEATGAGSYLTDALRWRDVLLRDYRDPETGFFAMTSRNADPLVVRPEPTHDDAVPNANGVFAEALVRLAQITGQDEDHRCAAETLTALSAVASQAPLGHTSILNAFDLYARGLTILVTGSDGRDLRDAALRLPYLDRSVSVSGDIAALGPNHPARTAALPGREASAVICAGMRCSLPVTTPDALVGRARDMLTGTSAGP